MSESIPVPNWTPPVPTPSSRPSVPATSTGRADFESALRRADVSSDRARPDDEDAEVEDTDGEAAPGAAVHGQRDGLTGPVGQGPLDEWLDTESIHEYALSAEGAPLIDGAAEGPGESATPSPAASTPGSVLMAESVAAMMMRLERSPEAMAGRWQFNLLNDPSGIGSLQLQRSINGSWKVSVSVSGGSPVDPEQDASELQQALEASGHSIESVEIASGHPGDASDTDIHGAG